LPAAAPIVIETFNNANCVQFDRQPCWDLRWFVCHIAYSDSRNASPIAAIAIDRNRNQDRRW